MKYDSCVGTLKYRNTGMGSVFSFALVGGGIPHKKSIVSIKGNADRAK